MSNVFFIIALIAGVLALGSVGFGLFASARDDEGGPRRSNKLMQSRIFFQAVAIVALVLAFLTRG